MGRVRITDVGRWAAALATVFLAVVMCGFAAPQAQASPSGEARSGALQPGVLQPEAVGAFLSVYVQRGDSATPELVKSYTQSEYAALKSDSAAVLSGIYYSSGKMNVSTAVTYVTLQDLAADVGLDYWYDSSTADVKVASDTGKTSVFTANINQLRTVENKFFPRAGLGDANAADARAFEPVLTITGYSDTLTSGTAASLEAYNASRADSLYAPRFVCGISEEQLSSHATTGTRALHHVNAVTFVIRPTFKVSIDPRWYYYDGTAKCPDVTITDAATGQELDSSGFTVTYANNVAAGRATVSVTRNGVEDDMASMSYAIVDQGTDPADVPDYNAGDGSGDSPSNVEAPSGWKRLWGDKALDTMAKVVQAGFSRSDAVVIATSDGYWDALAASALAGKLGAPVLLTSPDSLSIQASAEITRLRAARAYIVGGEAALSGAVEQQVAALLGGSSQVTRLAGDDAQDTAREIAAEIGGARASTCVIATSDGYWDALSAGPYSYAAVAPIYLTDARGVLAPQTLAAIREGGYERAVIAGGTAAVDGSAEAALADAGVGEVVRLGGLDSYETSGLVAEWGIGQGLSADGMGVATAGGYWDALTGAALCGKERAVLVLADEGHTANTAVASEHAAGMSHGYVFGGTSAVPDAVERAFASVTGM